MADEWASAGLWRLVAAAQTDPETLRWLGAALRQTLPNVPADELRQVLDAIDRLLRDHEGRSARL